MGEHLVDLASLTMSGDKTRRSPEITRPISPSSCANLATTCGPAPWVGSNGADWPCRWPTRWRRPPHAARLADQRMIAKRPSRSWNCGVRAPLLEDLVALVNLQRLDRDRGRDRMTRVGEAVPEHADLPALDEHRLVHGSGIMTAAIGR